MSKIIKLLLLSIFSLCILLSCTVGLGKEIDLEAPELTVKEMYSGGVVPKTSFETAIYTKQKVTFRGLATDNSNVSRVSVDIKWLGDNDYSFLKNASLDGNNWTLDIDFEKEGACWLKITAIDERKNYGLKSSKIISLFVDEKAPVGDAWYIDRQVNGVQYQLQSLETLKDIIKSDPKLEEPANIDVAQNGEFTICSSFNDASGISSTTISIWNEDGVKISGDIRSSSDSVYAPRFVINKSVVPGLAGEGKNEPYYYQIRYSSEDVVTDPEPNACQDVEFDMGWFVWWPESDNPRCSVTNLANNSLSLNVGGSLNVTVFDDDELKTGTKVVCTLKGETTVTKEYSVNKSGERSCDVVVPAPKDPQKMTLTVTATDKNGKALNRNDITVYVTSDAKPNLIITTPESNQIPSVTGTDANVTVSGIAMDGSGCSYLEFVWVPSSVADKRAKAIAWLDDIRERQANSTYAPAVNAGVKVTSGAGQFAGLKLWSVELKKDTVNSTESFIRYNFDFTLSIMNDFGTDKKADKNFFIRLTRKDGNYAESELKLSADEVKPEIVPVVPGGNMSVIDQDSDLKIQFHAEKANGLPMNTSMYKIYSVDTKTGAETLLAGKMNGVNYELVTPISKATLASYAENRINPKYRFEAEDILGNTQSSTYQFVISSLPQIKSVTSSAPEKCEKGREIDINVSFSKAVTCPSDAKLRLTNIENSIKSIAKTAEVYADYKSGSGSTTLVFKYVVQDGDKSEGLQVVNKSGVGPIIGIPASTAHLETLKDSDNLQAKRSATPIKIDGVAPKVKSISVTTDAVAANKKDSVYYLKSGRTITATVKTDKKVSVQGSPVLYLFKDSRAVYLTWQTITSDSTGSTILFSKKIVDTDANGAYSYNTNTCIRRYINGSYTPALDIIKDDFGNSLIGLADTVINTDFEIDTVVPATPVLTLSDENRNSGTNRYKNTAKFTIDSASSDTSIKSTEYSLNGGTSWTAYASQVSLISDASLVARRTDYAGNVSEYTTPVNVEVNSTFPDFTLECTNGDGNNKIGTELEFKLYFSSPVNIPRGSQAYIGLSKNNSNEKLTADARALLKDNSQNQIEVTEAVFTYVTKETDEFTLKVAKGDVVLTGFVDMYGIGQGSKQLAADYVREKLVCDSIPPAVKTMTPGTKVSTVNGKNVYSGANRVVLEFDEPVKAVTGKIYLRQTAGWAIPTIFTASEFNEVKSAVEALMKQGQLTSVGASNLTGTQILYYDGEEDSEWLFGSDSSVNKIADDRYHGTGQYIGPYKKSTAGINSDGSPDISTKYVLDFDMDPWTTDTTSGKTKFGKTFAANNRNQNNVKSDKTSGHVVVNAGKDTITVPDIRQVLEAVHLHERYMNVNSSSVQFSNNNKTVTLNFPAGLLGDEALPDGREWELVIEKGAFIDETGNKFGYNPDGSLADESDFELITNEGNNSFLSSGVAKPEIRVDKYSYGLGIYQPSALGKSATTNPNEISRSLITERTEVYNGTEYNKPTGKARVRIDCATKGAQLNFWYEGFLNYLTDDPGDVSHHVNSNASYEDKDLTNPGIGNCVSYWTETGAPDRESQGAIIDDVRVFFTAGGVNFQDSCKIYIWAKSLFNGSESEKANDGVFKTVLHIVSPMQKSGTPLGSLADGYNDLAVRGTTGFAGEPYISPFPLRDSQIGSPFLRRAYRVGNDYYWVSFEILVDTSFSCRAYHKDNRYDWSRSWGVLKPGEFTRCINMRQWGY